MKSLADIKNSILRRAAICGLIPWVPVFFLIAIVLEVGNRSLAFCRELGGELRDATSDIVRGVKGAW